MRLFVLIIAPTKEKSTKDSLETGRTFATMLADAHFRHRLLHAQDAVEFRSLMVARAQQLAQNQRRFKNRHKYMFEPGLNAAISTTSLDECHEDRKVSAEKFSQSPMASSPDQQYRQREGSAISRVLFDSNPRTGKLFELIGNHASGDLAVDCITGAKRKSHDMELAEAGKMNDSRAGATAPTKPKSGCCGSTKLEFGLGAWSDFKRRLKFYPSDFRDAFVGPPRTIQKTVATIWFLYFGILLPTIAFSSLNTVQTHGHMGDLRKAIIGQAIGGLGFALLGGQPLVIIMTTAPLCLYTKVVHQMCLDYGFPFPAMYAAVGLWNGVFLTLYSLFGFSKLMKWCTRSTEEIFALFIVVAFVTDASKDMLKSEWTTHRALRVHMHCRRSRASFKSQRQTYPPNLPSPTHLTSE